MRFQLLRCAAVPFLNPIGIPGRDGSAIRLPDCCCKQSGSGKACGRL